MNIFYLDHNPVLAAQYHCDKHVVKMILESAQLLCTAINVQAGEQITPYKSTHVTHPCTIWAGASIENWLWLSDLAYNLESEWRYRWQHDKYHQSISVIDKITFKLAESLLPAGPMTEPPKCMPSLYHIANDTVSSYRYYYKVSKHNLLHYTRRLPPNWLTE
jgi:hypothetical protein